MENLGYLESHFEPVQMVHYLEKFWVGKDVQLVVDAEFDVAACLLVHGECCLAVCSVDRA